MSLLKVIDVTQEFGDQLLYKNVNFELYKGEHIGVVGKNGAGKSTLIKILIGESIPDKGQVKWQSKIKMGILDQYALVDNQVTVDEYLHTAFDELYTMEEKMKGLYEEGALKEDQNALMRAAKIQDYLLANDFYLIDSQIDKVAEGLGIMAFGMDHLLGKLSGGQRAKVILAKLLLSNPDVLLLDEPTNFLDAEHIEWLTRYLMDFEGAFIVVSHDFKFLEEVSTGILDIEFQEVKKYHGSYKEFIKQKKHLREDHIRQYEAQRREIERTEAYIRKNKAGVNSKMARGRQKQLDRLERIAPPGKMSKPVIAFMEEQQIHGNALTVKGLEVGYYYPLLPKQNVTIVAGQKIVMKGFNGIGKSTLLKTLVGELKAISGSITFSEQGKIGYYEQDLIWEDPKQSAIEFIAEKHPHLNTKEIRRKLARCGLTEELILRSISTLSGGEQSRVKLCHLMLTPCNILILDEPTNHLDDDTKEALKKSLMEYKGTVILVSHEESFYKKWADKVMDIRPS